MEYEAQQGSDLRVLKMGIWLISVLSGFLRLFIAAQYQQLDMILEKDIFLGYFALPVAMIMAWQYLWHRSFLNDIAVKHPLIYQALLHIIYIGFYCCWSHFYIVHFGWHDWLVVIASALDLLIIIMLAVHFVYDEPPRYTYV